MNEPKKISLLDLLIIILEQKKFFIISMLLFSAAGIIVSFVIHPDFQAKAIILPPKQQSMSPLGSMMGDLPVSGLLKSLDVFGNMSNSDKFISILKSKRLAQQAIDTFDLAARYEIKKKNKKKYFIEDVYKAFYRHVKIEENDLSNIEIAVIDTSPHMAADMANFLVIHLDKINYEISKESARNSRVFFEDRLEVIKSDLDSAARKFTEFQIKNNYLDLDEQVKASIEALAKFEAEKMAIDIQIEQLKSQFGPNSQNMQELVKNRQVLENRIRSYMANGSGDLIISLKKAPALGVKYAYLMRDVKVQEALYKFVIQMYEQAKFSEANNVPAVQVLEWAQAPQKKLRPKRSAICLLFFFVGFSLTSVVILLRKWFVHEKENQSDAYFKVLEIYSHLLFRK